MACRSTCRIAWSPATTGHSCRGSCHLQHRSRAAGSSRDEAPGPLLGSCNIGHSHSGLIQSQPAASQGCNVAAARESGRGGEGASCKIVQHPLSEEREIRVTQVQRQSVGRELTRSLHGADEAMMPLGVVPSFLPAVRFLDATGPLDQCDCSLGGARGDTCSAISHLDRQACAVRYGSSPHR